jgi:hypothetical protein
LSPGRDCGCGSSDDDDDDDEEEEAMVRCRPRAHRPSHLAPTQGAPTDATIVVILAARRRVTTLDDALSSYGNARTSAI